MLLILFLSLLILSRSFCQNIKVQIWLSLQMDYDLDTAEYQYAKKINKEVQEYQEAV